VWTWKEKRNTETFLFCSGSTCDDKHGISWKTRIYREVVKFPLTLHRLVHCSTKRAPFARTPLREVECLSVDDADSFHFDIFFVTAVEQPERLEKLMSSLHQSALLYTYWDVEGSAKEDLNSAIRKTVKHAWSVIGHLISLTYFCETEGSLRSKLLKHVKLNKIEYFVIMWLLMTIDNSITII